MPFYFVRADLLRRMTFCLLCITTLYLFSWPSVAHQGTQDQFHDPASYVYVWIRDRVSNNTYSFQFRGQQGVSMRSSSPESPGGFVTEQTSPITEFIDELYLSSAIYMQALVSRDLMLDYRFRACGTVRTQSKFPTINCANRRGKLRLDDGHVTIGLDESGQYEINALYASFALSPAPQEKQLLH